MTATWHTVRVFISSTFRDMHSERDWLVRVVFPELRERLEKHRIHLVDIDLRRGVCRSFFVGLLGERGGWLLHRVKLVS